jgi:predicted DNA-binding transcriptional regulator YafY
LGSPRRSFAEVAITGGPIHPDHLGGLVGVGDGLIEAVGQVVAAEKGRPHSRRQGYAIGTALLSADQLLEVHGQLKASLDRLSDQSQKPLLHALEDRLKRAGSPGRRHQPKRPLANRSFTAEVPGTLASPEQAARLERAIRDRRRVWLRHQSDAIHFRAWPVQLLFHSISWYLAFETAEIGHQRGLIRCLRVDRLVLLNEDGNARRSSDAEHDDALGRQSPEPPPSRGSCASRPPTPCCTRQPFPWPCWMSATSSRILSGWPA